MGPSAIPTQPSSRCRDHQSLTCIQFGGFALISVTMRERRIDLRGVAMISATMRINTAATLRLTGRTAMAVCQGPGHHGGNPSDGPTCASLAAQDGETAEAECLQVFFRDSGVASRVLLTGRTHRRVHQRERGRLDGGLLSQVGRNAGQGAKDRLHSHTQHTDDSAPLKTGYGRPQDRPP
jgi:hypothetical protein